MIYLGIQKLSEGYSVYRFYCSKCDNYFLIDCDLAALDLTDMPEFIAEKMALQDHKLLGQCCDQYS